MNRSIVRFGLFQLFSFGLVSLLATAAIALPHSAQAQTNLIQATAFADDVGAFGAVVGDELRLQFDDDLDQSQSLANTRVEFGSAQGLECQWLNVGCEVDGSELIITASGTFSGPRNLQGESVTGVPNLIDSNSVQVIVGSVIIQAAPVRFVAETGSDAGNDCLNGSNPCATVQHAVDQADSGDVIQVSEGGYNEDVVVDTPALVLRGPNVGLAGQDGSRVAEAQIEGSIRVEADDVIVDGFQFIDPDPSSFTQAVKVAQGSSLRVQNSVFEGFRTQVSMDFAGGTPSNVTLTRNLFANVHANGTAIGSTENVNGLTITDNVFDNNRNDIGLGFGASGVVIENNQFIAGGSELYVSNRIPEVITTADILNNNTFDPAAAATTFPQGEFIADAAIIPDDVINIDKQLQFGNIQDAVDSADPGNTIEVTAGIYDGFRTRGQNDLTIRSTEAATIIPTSISGETVGVYVELETTGLVIDGLRFDGDGIAVFTQGVLGTLNTAFTVQNSEFTNLRTGVVPNASASGNVEVAIIDNTFSWNVSAIGGTESTNPLVVIGNTFENNRNGIGVANDTGGIDIQDNTFLIDDVADLESTFGASARYVSNRGELQGQPAEDVIANNSFVPEARFALNGNNETNIVPVGSGEVSTVTIIRDGATVAGFNAIQTAINAAIDGDTVLVSAGTFAESLTISGKTDLTLLGAQAGVSPLDGRSAGDAAETVIDGQGGVQTIQLGAGASGVTVDGFSITSTASTTQGVVEITPLVGTTVRNNFIYGYPGSLGVSISAGSTQSLIEANHITGVYAGVYLSTNSGSLTVTGNRIENLAPGSGGDQGSAVVLEGNHLDVSVIGNELFSNAHGVFLFSGFGEDLDGTLVSDNAIVGNAAGITNNRSTTLDASCNWWGDESGPSGEGDGAGDSVSENVDFEPWQASIGGSCTGFASPVTRQSDSAVFGSFTDAINDAGTLDGDVLQAESATYVENLIVNRPLTLRGTGAGNTTVLVGGIRIAANDVTIEDMQIQGGAFFPSDTAAIFIDGGTSGHTIQRTALLGNDVSGTRGILFGGGVSNVLVDDNVITDWASGIYINPTSGANIQISGNTISGNFAGVGGDNYSGVAITGNDIEDNVEGIGYSGADTGPDPVSGNSFNGNTANIRSYGPTLLDVEDILANNTFPQTVTNLDKGEIWSTIQSAIDAADPDNSLLASADTFTENLDVTNTSGLTLLGAQAGISAGVGGSRNAASTAGESILVGTIDFGGGTPTVSDLTIDGFRMEQASLGAVRIDGQLALRNLIVEGISQYFVVTVGIVDNLHEVELSDSTITIERGFTAGNSNLTSLVVSGNVFNQTAANLISGSALDGAVIMTDNVVNSPRGINVLSNDNVIADNVFNVPAGASSRAVDLYETSGNQITGNVFNTDDATGILVIAGGRGEEELLNNISNNQFLGTDANGIVNTITKLVDASCNWWGDDSGAGGEGPGGGTPVSENVNTIPWNLEPTGQCFGANPDLMLEVGPGLPAGVPEDAGWDHFTAHLTNDGDAVPENVLLWIEVDGIDSSNVLERSLQYFDGVGWVDFGWAGFMGGDFPEMDRQAYFIGRDGSMLVGFEIDAGYDSEIPLRVDWPNGAYQATITIESFVDGQANNPGERIYLTQTEALLVQTEPVAEAFVNSDYAGSAMGEALEFTLPDGTDVDVIFGLDAFASPYTALAAIAEGGTVRVASGDFFDLNELQPLELNTEGVIFTTDPANAATLRYGFTDFFPVIEVFAENTTVENFNLVRDNGGSASQAIAVRKAGSIVQGLTIVGSNNDNIAAITLDHGLPSEGYSSIVDNVLITNNTVSGDFVWGISVATRSTTGAIEGATISDNLIDGTINGVVFFTSGTGTEAGISNIVYTGNTHANLSGAATLFQTFSVLDPVQFLADNTVDRWARVDDGDNVFLNIQPAINAATDGDTVLVSTGTFAESLTVSGKTDLTLLGAQAGVSPLDGRSAGDAAETVIDGQGGVQTIQLGAGASGVTVDGFSITSTASTTQGVVEITPLVGTTVRNNFIYGYPGSLGVSISAGSTQSLIEANHITGVYAGVYLSTNSGSLTVTGNRIENLAPGSGGDQGSAVVLEGNHLDVSVIGNELFSNAHGVFLFSGFGEDLDGTLVSDNAIVGNAAGITNNRSTTLDASCNWWGNENGPSGQGSGDGDSVSAAVDFIPWNLSTEGSCNGGIDEFEVNLIDIASSYTAGASQNGNEQASFDYTDNFGGVQAIFNVFTVLDGQGDPIDPSVYDALFVSFESDPQDFIRGLSGTSPANVVAPQTIDVDLLFELQDNAPAGTYTLVLTSYDVTGVDAGDVSLADALGGAYPVLASDSSDPITVLERDTLDVSLAGLATSYVQGDAQAGGEQAQFTYSDPDSAGTIEQIFNVFTVLDGQGDPIDPSVYDALFVSFESDPQDFIRGLSGTSPANVVAPQTIDVDLLFELQANAPAGTYTLVLTSYDVTGVDAGDVSLADALGGAYPVLASDSSDPITVIERDQLLVDLAGFEAAYQRGAMETGSEQIQFNYMDPDQAGTIEQVFNVFRVFEAGTFDEVDYAEIFESVGFDPNQVRGLSGTDPSVVTAPAALGVGGDGIVSVQFLLTESAPLGDYDVLITSYDVTGVAAGDVSLGDALAGVYPVLDSASETISLIQGPDLVLAIEGPSLLPVAEEGFYDVRLENQGDAATDENVEVQFAIARAGIEPGDVVIDYCVDPAATSGEDCQSWLPLMLDADNGSLSGRFGPAAGFEVPAGYDETTFIRVNIGEPGNYDVLIAAVGVDSETELASSMITVSVTELSFDIQAGVSAGVPDSEAGWAYFTGTLVNLGDELPENVLLWTAVDGIGQDEFDDGAAMQWYNPATEAWTDFGWGDQPDLDIANQGREAFFLGRDGMGGVTGFPIGEGEDFVTPIRVNFDNAIYDFTTTVESLDAEWLYGEFENQVGVISDAVELSFDLERGVSAPDQPPRWDYFTATLSNIDGGATPDNIVLFVEVAGTDFAAGDALEFWNGSSWQAFGWDAGREAWFLGRDGVGGVAGFPIEADQVFPIEVRVNFLPDSYAFTVTVESIDDEIVGVGGVYAVFEQNVEVLPTEATITFNAADLVQTFDGNVKTVGVTTAPEADLDVDISFDPAPPVNAGSYLVNAVITDPYFVGSAATSLLIEKGQADVVLDDLSQVYADGAELPVSVDTDPAGLDVIVTYDGSAAVPTDVGSYSVVATVNDANWTGSAAGILQITPATADVILDDLVQPFDGTPREVTVDTVPSGLNVVVTYDGSQTAPVNVGSYAVVATVVDDNYMGSATATLVVEQIEVTDIQIHDLTQVFDGTPKPVSVITDPPGLGFEVSYDGDAAAPIDADSYDVVVTIVDQNYFGSAMATLEIEQAGQTIDFAALPDRTVNDSPFTLMATADSGLTVSFELISGPATVVGDEVTLTGDLGEVVIEASQPGDGNWLAAPSVQQSFQVTEGNADRIEAVSDIEISGTAGQPVDPGDLPVVRVLDEFDNPVAGVTVSFEIGSGSGSLTGATQVTDGDGLASLAGWTLGAEASQTILAVAPGLSDSPVSFTATVTPAADLRVTIDDNRETIEVGERNTYVVVVTNAGPNAISDVEVDVTLPDELDAATAEWTCFPAGGASCETAGTGSIADTVDVPVSGSLVYILQADVLLGPTQTIVKTAVLTPPSDVSIVDPDALESTVTTQVVVTEDGIFRDRFEEDAPEPNIVSSLGGARSELTGFIELPELKAGLLPAQRLVSARASFDRVVFEITLVGAMDQTWVRLSARGQDDGWRHSQWRPMVTSEQLLAFDYVADSGLIVVAGEQLEISLSLDEPARPVHRLLASPQISVSLDD